MRFKVPHFPRGGATSANYTRGFSAPPSRGAHLYMEMEVDAMIEGFDLGEVNTFLAVNFTRQGIEPQWDFKNRCFRDPEQDARYRAWLEAGGPDKYKKEGSPA